LRTEITVVRRKVEAGVEREREKRRGMIKINGIQKAIKQNPKNDERE
jgi:hypothetical protein